MSLFNKEPALFAEVARKVNATSAWEMFDKPLLSHQVAQNIELPQGDWTERWFFKGNHIYEYLSEPICSVKDCTLEDVIEALNTVGVHPRQKKPFIPGKYYKGDANIPGPFGPDHVTTIAIYDDKGSQVGARNTTELDHALHPGIVERRVIEKNGFYHIYTEGGGYGQWGAGNILLDEIVWSEVDDRVIELLNISQSTE